MHEKTLILPIANQIEKMSKDFFSRVTIRYGEYSGLTPSTIIAELRILLPNHADELESIKFQLTEGKINCLDCDYTGKGGNVYAEPISHHEIIVECPSCASSTTVITDGRDLDIFTS